MRRLGTLLVSVSGLSGTTYPPGTTVSISGRGSAVDGFRQRGLASPCLVGVLRGAYRGRARSLSGRSTSRPWAPGADSPDWYVGGCRSRPRSRRSEHAGTYEGTSRRRTLRRVRRHHDPHSVRGRGGGAGRRRRADGRRPRQHRLGLGPRRHARRLRRGPDQRGATSTRRSPSRSPRSRASRGARCCRTSLAQFLGRVRRRAASCAGTTPRCCTTVDPGLHHQDPGRLLHPAGQRRRCRSASWGAFRDQIIGTAILLFLIFALTDLPTPRRGPTWRRSSSACSWSAIGMAWGTNAGYAINPARDFGPRLASLPHRLRTARGAISTASSTSGCRSSARSSAACSAPACTRS